MKLSNDPKAGRVATGLLVAGIVLFGASFNDPFHFDDVLITNDANVTNPAQWAHFFNPLYLRQLTFFSFYVNHLLTGENAAGYHVVNVMLHIANAFLLFFLLGRFLERWIAVAAAAIFLAHPVQTEPVLYIYQRSTLLACFFSLLALIALSEKRNWLAVVFFICAFEGKESALAIPIAVAALREARARQREALEIDRRYTIGLIVGAVVLAVATLGLLTYWEEDTVGIGAAAEMSPVRYFMAQTRVVYTYLRLLIFPYPQSLEYEFPSAVGILPLIGILAMVAAGWWLSRQERWRLPGLCVLAFFVLLAPTSSIIPSADPAFEHRLYLPMLAFALLTACLLSKIPRRNEITTALLCVLTVLTIYRGTVWASDIALWEDTVKHAPGKARAWFNLGGAYLNTNPDRARAALLRALELQPDFVEVLYDIGLIEQGKGNWPTALAYYERAMKQKPGYWPAWNNTGNTLFAMGQPLRAIEYFEKTLSLNPDYWPAQYNVAVVQYKSGRFDAAIPRLRTVLDWHPEHREARRLLALALGQAGHLNEAAEEWKKLGEPVIAPSTLSPATISGPISPWRPPQR
jgi:tetratricopeptide (TPR) repeat protein